MRTVASPDSARTSSSGSPVAWTDGRSSTNTSIASRFRRASTRASARESAASTRARSSAETPLARKPTSTPRRSASHSTVSRVGRVFPRSIWLTYSFEKRSPASSVWVNPAATRSWRNRSPRRRADWAAVARWVVAGVLDMCGEANPILHKTARCPFCHPPQRACIGAFPVNHAARKIT